jgi:predicted Zn-dependent protease
VSPRLRVVLVALALAAAAGAAVVGIAVATGGSEPHLTFRQGTPPLALDLGLRSDPETRALRRAELLYARGRRADAGRIFARYSSVAAQVGAAFAGWPHGSLARMETLAAAHPASAFVQLHYGLALFWAHREQDAVSAWAAAMRTDPDTPSAVAADDLLHPNFPRGLPAFVASFSPPPRLQRLAPERQVEALARAASHDGARAKILYGVTLQHLGHPRSAERWFARAAAQAPDDAEAEVAAAVGRFRKADPARAFSRLGPLVRRFPHAPTVRFHLGLLLLWIGRVDAARTELQRARREGPRTAMGREAGRFLAQLESLRR